MRSIRRKKILCENHLITRVPRELSLKGKPFISPAFKKVHKRNGQLQKGGRNLCHLWFSHSLPVRRRRSYLFFCLLYLTRFAIAAKRDATTHNMRKIVKTGYVESPSIKSTTSVADQMPVVINHNIGTHKGVLVVFITVFSFLFYIYFPSAICLATYTPLADACEREWVMPLPSPMI